MIGYRLHLACGHQTPERYGPKLPPYLAPSEAAWSLAWCGDCQAQQKVTDVQRIDGDPPPAPLVADPAMLTDLIQAGAKVPPPLPDHSDGSV